MDATIESLGEQRADSPAVLTAIDTVDNRDHVVVADITRDDCWLMMPESEAATLDEWR